MEKYLMGVDLGTTSVKGLLYTASGTLKASAEAFYNTYYPHTGWAEQDGREWWQASVNVMRQLTAGMGAGVSDIAGVCCSSHGISVLPVDADGVPLCRASIWMDRRAVEESRELGARFGDQAYRFAFGAPPDASYFNARLLWAIKHEPRAMERAVKIHSTNTYINYKLTGESAIDYEQLSAMSHVVEPETCAWSSKMSDCLGLDLKAMMPELRRCYEVIGAVTAKAAEETGLAAGTPVLCGTADGVSAILESGVNEPGVAADITGTSSILFYAAEKPVPEGVPLISNPQHFPFKDVSHLWLGPINCTGASLKWFTQICGGELLKAAGTDKVYHAIDLLAAQAEPGGNGLLFFPYLSGERAPLFNSYVRGMFIGLTSLTGLPEMSRSLLEGTAFAVRHVTEHAQSAGLRIKRFNITGGGANSDIWVKIKASVLKQAMHVSKGTGGAAMGDAMIAGYGLGLYGSYTEAMNIFRQLDKIVEPDMEWAKVYDELYGFYTGMRERLDPDLERMSLLRLG